MRRFALLTVALAFAAATARAAPRDLAEVSVDAPLAAYGGWVVWSVASADQRSWTLSAVHEGKVVALPVRPRGAAFDLDLGSSRRPTPDTVSGR